VSYLTRRNFVFVGCVCVYWCHVPAGPGLHA